LGKSDGVAGFLIREQRTVAATSVRHWTFVGLLLLAMGAPGLVFGAELSAPVISIAGIHSPTLSTQGAQLICSVRVENPNDVALPLTGGNVDLKLAGSPAAKGRLLKRITIPARTTRDVDLLVDLDVAATVSWLPLFMDTAAFTVPFEVDGYVDIDNVDLGRVLFHETGDVSMTAEGLEVTQVD
jgi:LEA14-like dessication related protein